MNQKIQELPHSPNGYFIVGDVAGRYDETVELLSQRPEGSLPVFVGDLNGRGYQSKQVIQMVKSFGWPCLHSNHGDILVDWVEWKYGFKEEPIYSYGGTRCDFFANGEGATLLSYVPNDGAKVDREALIKDCYWLKNLPYAFRSKKLWITHAPVYPGLTLELATQKVDELGQWKQGVLWNRTEPAEVSGVVQVFGHNRHPKVTKLRNSTADVYAVAVDISGHGVGAVHFPTLKTYEVRHKQPSGYIEPTEITL